MLAARPDGKERDPRQVHRRFTRANVDAAPQWLGASNEIPRARAPVRSCHAFHRWRRLSISDAHQPARRGRPRRRARSRPVARLQRQRRYRGRHQHRARPDAAQRRHHSLRRRAAGLPAPRLHHRLGLLHLGGPAGLVHRRQHVRNARRHLYRQHRRRTRRSGNERPFPLQRRAQGHAQDESRSTGDRDDARGAQCLLQDLDPRRCAVRHRLCRQRRRQRRDLLPPHGRHGRCHAGRRQRQLRRGGAGGAAERHGGRSPRLRMVRADACRRLSVRTSSVRVSGHILPARRHIARRCAGSLGRHAG